MYWCGRTKLSEKTTTRKSLCLLANLCAKVESFTCRGHIVEQSYLNHTFVKPERIYTSLYNLPCIPVPFKRFKEI